MELVERAELLAELRALLAQARAGSGRVVLLGGEAGVGKTSLIREFVARKPGLRILWGSCEPLLTPEPLGPFHDMPPIAAAIVRKESRIELLGAILDQLRTPPGTVLVVEDAHWADEASLDALRYVGRRAHTTPGMLVLTFRDDEALPGSPLRSVVGDLATAPGCRRLHVPPLSAAAVAELADGIAIDAGRLHATTGGNPFFVTEVLAAPGWTVPPTVGDAVLARVARLDPSARSLLEVVAMAPVGLEPAIAMAMSGHGDSALDECVQHGVLILEAERMVFRHELARLAVEEAVPATRRRQLHRVLLAELEQRAQVDHARLAHHAQAAGDDPAVLRYEPLAAQDASVSGAYRAAAAHLGRAVASSGCAAAGEQARLVSAWADARVHFDDPREVMAVRQRALALWRQAGDHLGEGRELVEIGRTSARLGDANAGEAAIVSAIAILEPLPPGPALAYAYANAAFLAIDGGRIEEALGQAAQALDVADMVGGTKARIIALRVLGRAENLRGRSDVGFAAYEEIRRIAISTGDHEAAVVASSDAAFDLLWMRRYGEALDRFREAIEVAQAMDFDKRVRIAEAFVASIHFEQGRWGEAEAIAARLLAEQPQHHFVRSQALTIQARIGTRRGDAGALALFDEAWQLFADAFPVDRWEIAAARAEHAWLDGQPERIPALVSDLWEGAVATNTGRLAGELAFWLWRADALPVLPTDIAEPLALHLAGDWSGAAVAWERLGCPYDQAVALADGDEAAMRRALAIFTSLGAEPAANRLRERMRRAGIAGIPARPRRSTVAAPAQLTRRQLEILVLVEQGLTNKEIAERLYITEKTAGHHVSAVLAKLGARTRTEAASTARKMGIGPSER